MQDGWLGFDGIVYRKRMSAKSFYNGFLSKCERKLAVFTSLPNDLEKYLSASPTTVSPQQRLDANDGNLSSRLRAVNCQTIRK